MEYYSRGRYVRELPAQLARHHVGAGRHKCTASGSAGRFDSTNTECSVREASDAICIYQRVGSLHRNLGSLDLPTTSPLAAPGSNYYQRKGFPFSGPSTPASTPTFAVTNTKKRVLTEAPPNTEQPLLNKFILYESKAKCYVVAGNTNDSRHRMLKIDRTNQDELGVGHNDITYTEQQMNGVIKMLEDGKRARVAGASQTSCLGPLVSGGPFSCVRDMSISTWYTVGRLRQVYRGMVHDPHDKRSVVALIGGHNPYHLECTDMLPIALNHKIDNLVEEQRLLMIFRPVDMTKTFYFSYTNDITSTLQRNLTRMVPTSMGWGLSGALLGTIICLSLHWEG